MKGNLCIAVCTLCFLLFSVTVFSMPISRGLLQRNLNQKEVIIGKIIRVKDAPAAWYKARGWDYPNKRFTLKYFDVKVGNVAKSSSNIKAGQTVRIAFMAHGRPVIGAPGIRVGTEHIGKAVIVCGDCVNNYGETTIQPYLSGFGVITEGKKRHYDGNGFDAYIAKVPGFKKYLRNTGRTDTDSTDTDVLILSAEPGQDKYAKDEPVTLEIRLTNKGEKDLCVNKRLRPFFFRSLERDATPAPGYYELEIIVIPSDGGSLTPVMSKMKAGAGPPGRRLNRPGKQDFMILSQDHFYGKQITLTDRYEFSPGKYTINVQYHNRNKGENLRLDAKAWTGSLKTETVSITVE